MNRTAHCMFFGWHAPLTPGQQEYTTPGTYSLVVPENAYAMHFVLLQAGGGGGDSTGGDGGDLRWKNDIIVVPGETLTIVVPAGGAASFDDPLGTPGAHTTVSRGGTLLLSSATPLGDGVGGGDGGTGGQHKSVSGDYGSARNGGGGGGAGGYTGNGGNGGDGQLASAPTAGSGGGGGGGGYDTSSAQENHSLSITYGQDGRSGGAVGLKGQGADGTAGVNASTPIAGGPGSSGVTNGRGGYGGFTMSIAGDDSIGGPGGAGGARAMWGVGRSYPSTRTADE